MRAVHGDFAPVFDEWIERVSVVGLVDWQYDGPPHSGFDADDLTLPGGDEAAMWVFDRSVHTGLAEWHRASLDWELRYAYTPVETAVAAGVPEWVLEERPSHADAVIAEIVRRITNPGVNDQVAAGLSRHGLFEQSLMLVQDGAPQVAALLLGEAVARFPQDCDLRSALAFCLLPSSPQTALKHLDACAPSTSEQRSLTAVNRAAALLRLQDRHTALTWLDQIQGDSAVLLWDPERILAPSEEMDPLWTTANTWVLGVRTLLADL